VLVRLGGTRRMSPPLNCGARPFQAERALFLGLRRQRPRRSSPTLCQIVPTRNGSVARCWSSAAGVVDDQLHASPCKRLCHRVS
jgi:hypothetical protein